MLPSFSVWVYKTLEICFRHIAFSLTLLLVTVLTYRAIYNRYFNPVHKFHGPFWGSVTDFYNTYFFSTRRAHVKNLHLHQKHGWLRMSSLEKENWANLATFLGPIVRIFPNLLCFSEPTLLPDIYNRYSNKTPFHSPAMAGEEPPFLQCRTFADHASKLKVIGPIVSADYSQEVVSADVVIELDNAYTTARNNRR